MLRVSSFITNRILLKIQPYISHRTKFRFFHSSHLASCSTIGIASITSTSHLELSANVKNNEVNDILLECFRKMSPLAMDENILDNILRQHISRMDLYNISTLLYNCRKRNYVMKPSHVEYLSDRMLQLSEINVHKYMQIIANMNSMPSTNYAARRFVGILAKKISLCPIRNVDRRSQSLTNNEFVQVQKMFNAMSGFRNFDSDRLEVRDLIAAISPHIRSLRKTSLPGRAVANALYGLQGFHSHHDQVGLTRITAPFHYLHIYSLRCLRCRFRSF